MYYYTYKIQFVDGYYYYGSRKSRKTPQNDRYFGSPKTHKDKWKTTMFEKIIIENYNTYNEVVDAEMLLIGDNHLKDDKCLNCCNVTNTGRISISHTQESKQKISDMAKQRKPVSDETRRKLSSASTGRVLSEETKEKIRKARAKQVFSDESRKKMSESAKNRKPISEETREKKRQAAIDARRNKYWSTKPKKIDSPVVEE